jgi:hypothetical protein
VVAVATKNKLKKHFTHSTMNNKIQRHAFLLAALLQVLPLVRNFLASPAATSTIAFVLRWGIGATVTAGAYDACSGASPSFISPTNFNATAGTYFSNSVVVSLVGTGNPASTSDGFILTNLLNTTQYSPFFSNGQSTTNALPRGLTCNCISLNNANYIYGSITGTPTTAGNYAVKFIVYSPGNGSKQTNVFFTVGSSAASPPVITNAPTSVTNVAGSSTGFSVVAGGTSPLNYQWIYNSSVALPGATNFTYQLANVRASQAGNYSVIITNTGGSVTSPPAALVVTLPPAPPVSALAAPGGQFLFTFNPVPGLTNTVLTNSSLIGGAWGVFTNIPPPTNNNSLTITDTVSSPKLFYRVLVEP